MQNSNFNWSEAKTGYIVDCIFMTDNSYLYSIEHFHFGLDEYAKLQKLIDAIENADNYLVTDLQRIIINRNNSLNEVSKLKLLEDLELETDTNRILGYRIIKNDDKGMSYALFDGKSYKKLTEKSHSCFNSWDCQYN